MSYRVICKENVVPMWSIRDVIHGVFFGSCQTKFTKSTRNRPNKEKKVPYNGINIHEFHQNRNMMETLGRTRTKLTATYNSVYFYYKAHAMKW